MGLQYSFAFIFSPIFWRRLQKYIDRRTSWPNLGILTPVMLIHFLDFPYLLEQMVSEIAGFLYLQLVRAQALSTLALG